MGMAAKNNGFGPPIFIRPQVEVLTTNELESEARVHLRPRTRPNFK
jgi:hypothetical protein